MLGNEMAMSSKQWAGENSRLGVENDYYGHPRHVAELSVFSFFGKWVEYFRFICRPMLHLRVQYPGTHLNHAERLTVKMSWTLFSLCYLMAGYEGK